MIDQFLPQSWLERTQFLLRRWIYHTSMVLIGAGIIHIVTVLMVPYFAENDAWSRLQDNAGHFAFNILETGQVGDQHLSGLDPLFVQSACRIETGIAPVEITFGDPDQLWSLSVYNHLNSVIFSLNNRTVEQGDARFLILTATQISQIRERDPLAYERNVIVETDEEALVVVLRIYAPTAPDRSQAAGIVASASCRALTIVEGS